VDSYARLEPQVIDELVTICNTMLHALERARSQAEFLAYANGFGAFESAKQLQAGFRRKASGSPTSAKERIDQFIDALTALRDAFASGGEAFLDAESDWARQLNHVGQEF
jgi:hypothetical protein